MPKWIERNGGHVFVNEDGGLVPGVAHTLASRLEMGDWFVNNCGIGADGFEGGNKCGGEGGGGAAPAKEPAKEPAKPRGKDSGEERGAKIVRDGKGFSKLKTAKARQTIDQAAAMLSERGWKLGTSKTEPDANGRWGTTYEIEKGGQKQKIAARDIAHWLTTDDENPPTKKTK